MFPKNNYLKKIHLTSIKAIAILVVLLFNLICAPVAFADDNYSAETDTYQETRNPNRVDTTAEELAQSNLDLPDEDKGKSIYESLVEKVDSRRDESLSEKK